MDLSNWVDLGNGYAVSDAGGVKSLARAVRCRWYTRPVRERILKPVLKTNGYYAVSFHGRDQHHIHILVAEAFLPKPNSDRRLCVNHMDGDKTNNRAANLEWVTFSDNMKHAFDTGLKQATRGSSSHLAKLTEGDVLEIRRLLACCMSQRKIADKFNVSRGAIQGIADGRNWGHLLCG